jgi:alkanesulfonate monooxygenase SsuD/methylene tetrahydromethanopterin reductase-like flavin-dependent oxidoreductase (luciferase family)
MTATVERVSHGRLSRGISASRSGRERQAHGSPLPAPGERVRRLAEAGALMRRRWRDPVANSAGRYDQLQEAYCAPKPAQPPQPGFATGAEGEHTLQAVARCARVWDCAVATAEA